MKEDKRELRRVFLAKRNKLPIKIKQDFDRSLNQRLIELVKKSDYNNVHVFLPMKSEPNIYPFIEYMLSKNLNVICPKSLPNGIIENYVLKSMKEVTHGIYGTSYPADSIVYTDEIELVIVPGLAYSTNMDRLGYGGGYYDRFLNLYRNSFKVAPAYKFQVISSLPVEEHDIKVDQVVLPQ